MLISIIVPIYNVEDYLDRCLDSLANQTFKNIELILVNDGSTDTSGNIAKAFASAHENAAYFYKENGGLSDARNFGLMKATGEYVLFVDSDDTIDINTCESFSRILSEEHDKKIDLIIGNAKVIETDGSKSIMQHTILDNNIHNCKAYMLTELENDTLYMAAWLNLYRKELLIDNNIQYAIGRLHEDEECTPRVLLKANYIYASDITFYNYYLRDGSITKKKSFKKNAEDLFLSLHELEDRYINIEDKKLQRMLRNSLVDKYLNMIQLGKLLTKEYRYLYDYRFLLRNAKTIKNRLKVFLFFINKKLYYNINNAMKGRNRN